ncbi:OsmC-like protein [Coniophora puteana RWD-64-598 SS2]|uniref:OsmC-like protein n=1 Tax=Coniophora puteana (strain RWD-64-598) TaxID=741705 RepID=A0A5M3MVV3_CONPW|nr:OsmC-like protein [Coniophora puteana RWD-64-598 SS2]EIW82845.1 OsmC-like protein [Coniophora puteana RWD-64-598 SS2]
MLSAARTTFAASRIRVGPTIARRTVVTLKDIKYTTTATATGQGRNGEVKSSDEKPFSLRLTMPKAMGGNGDGQNPEQLFAMGYASCFLGALQMMASKTGKVDAAKNAIIHTSVHLGKPAEMEGFALAVDIKVEGVEDEELIKAGHEACPYSRALEHGIVVNVSKA